MDILQRVKMTPKHLLVLWLFCGLGWLFIELAYVVNAVETVELDRTVLLALREAGDPTNPLGPTWLEEMMRDGTALGSNWILFFIVIIAAVYLRLVQQGRLAVFLLVAIVSGFVVAFSLKHGIDRPRPDLVPHATKVYTASFPSAHAMMSALVYFTLAGLLAHVERRRAVKSLLFVAAGVLTVWIGFSRVYLGVHWPSDVLAGWCAGGFWALFCYQVSKRLPIRGG